MNRAHFAAAGLFALVAGIVAGSGCLDAYAQANREYGGKTERIFPKGIGTDGLPEVLANDNTTGGTDIVISDGDALTCTDTSTSGSELSITATPSGARTDPIVSVTAAGSNWGAGPSAILATTADTTAAGVEVDAPADGIGYLLASGGTDYLKIYPTSSYALIEALSSKGLRIRNTSNSYMEITTAGSINHYLQQDITSGAVSTVFSDSGRGLEATTGTTYWLRLLPIINQTGDAAARSLSIDATETSLGSGGHDLAWFGVGGAEKGALDNAGNLDIAGDLTVGTYTLNHTVSAGGATLGPTAPSKVVKDTSVLVCFDADAEQVGIEYEVPDEWIGTTDIMLKVYWTFEDGDVPQLNETVKWDISYRSIVWGTEDTDNGTVATGTVTYTEGSDPGDDKNTVESEITLPYDDANQPLTAGDLLVILFDRDVTGDSYSGDACIVKWETALDANSFATHH